MVSIGSLRYDIIADTSQFSSGIVATRRELTAAKRVFEGTRTPAESLGIEIEGLSRLLEKGAIDTETFSRSVKSMGDGSEEAAKAQDEVIRNLRAEAAELERVTAGLGDYAREETDRARTLRQTADATEKLLREERDQRSAAQAAARAEADREAIMNRGIATTRRYETTTERFERELQDLNQELRAGVISQTTYARAIARATREANQQRLATLQQIPAFGRLTGSFGGMSAGMIAVIGGAAAFTAGLYAAARAASFLRDRVKEQMAAIDELAKTSRKLGTTTEELAGLRLAAAEFSGFGAQQFDTALQRMTRRLAEAAIGTGEAQGAIKELGLDAVALSKRGPAEAFREIAEAIKKVQSPADQLRIAFKLFDSEGAGLVTTLNAGSDAIAAMQIEAESLGIAVSAVDAASIEQANDALGRASAAVEGLYNDLAILLAPSIQVAAEELQEFAKWLRANSEALRDAQIVVAGYVGALVDLAEVLAAINKIRFGNIVGGLSDLFDSMEFDKAEEFARRAAEALQAAQDAANAASAAGSGAGGDAEGVDKVTQSIEARIQALKDEEAILVMGRNAWEYMDFARQGATESQLKELQQQQRLLEETKEMARLEAEQKKAQEEKTREAEKEAEEIKRQAERIAESVKTPMEKLLEDLNDVEVLVKVGALDQATAEKERQRLQNEFRNQNKPVQVELPPAVQRGSRDEFRMVASLANGTRERAEAQHREAMELRKLQLAALQQAANGIERFQLAESV